MSVKLIAIDIDGTLLNSKSELTDMVRSEVISASKKGVKIVLSSGRPFKGLKWLLEKLDLIKEDEYTIARNGPQVVRNIDEHRIYKKFIKASDAIRANEYAKDKGSSFFYFSDEEVITCEKEDEYVNIETTLNKLDAKVISFSSLQGDEEVCKMTFTSSSNLLNSIQKEVEEEFENDFTVVRSHKNFIELLNKESSKGEAIKFLCSHLGISIEETMGIGDNDNDYSLLKECKYKIVMANSKSEKLRSIATDIAPSNDEDGVAKIIQKYIN